MTNLHQKQNAEGFLKIYSNDVIVQTADFKALCQTVKPVKRSKDGKTVRGGRAGGGLSNERIVGLGFVSF